MSAFEETGRIRGCPAVDLNADLGEDCPNDRALLELVSSASIGCGAHAGSMEGIRQTLRDARECGVVVGAHPGYRDRAHFGRRELKLESEDVKGLILEQFSTLSELAVEAGVSVRFVKPHGALYNQAQRQPEIAQGVVAAVVALGVSLLGQPDTLLGRMASAAGVCFIAEGFPDRRYRDDGSLVPRSEPSALLHDPEEIESGLLRLVWDKRIATLCIHGDDPHALVTARLVRRVLQEHGIRIQSFLEEDAPNSDRLRGNSGR